MSPLFTCKISRSGNSYDYSKWTTAFLFSLYVTFLCAHSVLKGLFVRLVMPIYKTMHLGRTSSWNFSAHYLLLWWGGSSYRRALFSSLRLGIDSGLFVVNLVNLKSLDILFCCITHYTNCIIYLKEIQTKYRWCKFIGHFSKIFVFNYLEIRPILHYNHLLIPHKKVTDSESTHVISHFEHLFKHCS